MRNEDHPRQIMQRRNVLAGIGGLAAVSASVTAGCLDEDPEDPAAPDDEPENGDEEWADVDSIHFEGYTEAWRAVEPAHIEGEENPTLILFEGQSYTISFVNSDGAEHNLVIWDADRNVVDGNETEMTNEDGAEASLDVEATAEMAQYVCEPHQTTMIGEIEVREATADEGDIEEEE